MPSITDRAGVSPMTITLHAVPVAKEELEFLRARVDDPAARFNELKCFIDEFQTPKFALRTLITLVRKILVQNVLSRARALLALQPISQADAERLDSLIALKTHQLLGFPHLTVFDTNASLAVEGLARDLNHHIAAYRKMARITLADWQCSINGCVNPLDGAGLDRGFSRYRGRHPSAWITAQQAMGSLGVKLSLRLTDQRPRSDAR
ncbi:hypothetical protein BDZ89DRAFT_1241833 [Hymenopellis radicata]|nr:hypothetical protein BDZ89DRAFT_1241833 [Hymenopellis radicata]